MNTLNMCRTKKNPYGGFSIALPKGAMLWLWRAGQLHCHNANIGSHTEAFGPCHDEIARGVYVPDLQLARVTFTVADDNVVDRMRRNLVLYALRAKWGDDVEILEQAYLNLCDRSI